MLGTRIVAGMPSSYQDTNRLRDDSPVNVLPAWPAPRTGPDRSPPDPGVAAPARRDRLRTRLRAAGRAGLFVTHLPNVRYLTGFTGSFGALLMLRRRDVLLTDRRYDQQATAECVGVEVELAMEGVVPGAGRVLADAGLLARPAPAARVGFEPTGLSWAEGERLCDLVPGAEPLPPFVEEERVVKDDAELACMRAAATAGTAAFTDVLTRLRPGITERQVAWELESAMRRHGSEAPGFATIVAFGEQTAEPHHRPTDRALRRGDLVTMDFGATVRGYRSDMTRTVAVGPPPARLREVYALVQEAQAAGLAAVRAGAAAGDLDRACRQVIEAAGHGTAFAHPTGHGVGLEIHEAPRVRQGAADLVDPGTPLTIEPGVYLPGLGGVRIEDLVVARDGGYELLTTAPKDLLVL